MKAFTPPLPYTKGRTIGLLGGSFNPAHGGHRHITLFALRALGLDEVWWLVSPHNPLKSKESLADYGQRVASARQVAGGNRRIRVLDIEQRLATRYSFETIDALKKRHPGTRFVWLIGADNLSRFHRWRRWQYVLDTLPVAVFDRAPYSHTAPRSRAMSYGRRFIMKNSEVNGSWRAPGLLFVHLRRDPLSSTSLRNMLGEKAFLRHNNKAVKAH
jgi:nicotinate-nucleotide adenylyltransferase